jgi:proline iminopeptidase
MLAVEYILTRMPSGVRSLVLSAPCLSVSRWQADQRQYIEALPAATRETILQCEKDGAWNTPEYQDASMVFYRHRVCRLDTWPVCLEASMGKLTVDI